MRAPVSCATCHLTDFNETLKGLPQIANRQFGFCFGYLGRWGERSPLVFLGFHQGNCLKIGEMTIELSPLWYSTDYSESLHTYCYNL